ncbi:tat pathway signal sequence [Ophiostoma piceae UAMH 11346]|uniref:Tat pathway signal sequence n=1 Tax=Ophiostoma piceae (strain UAMH 11346) TaxID=1262450 RepID=S3BXC7_OPHP1|nr:tat pathway signal sequence [Ophiostoma piceae UAMH 11346]
MADYQDTGQDSGEFTDEQPVPRRKSAAEKSQHVVTFSTDSSSDHRSGSDDSLDPTLPQSQGRIEAALRIEEGPASSDSEQAAAQIEDYPGESDRDDDANDSMAVIPARDKAKANYAWANVNDESEKTAKIIEEAVDVALVAGQNIVDLLLTSAKHECRVNVKHWAKEFESIRDMHEQFNVHVGVSGATGAGKTSIINALLDYDELLPSGSDGAATASACVIHQNKDQHRGRKFRAVVHFKTAKEITEWLTPILADVAEYFALVDRTSLGGDYDDRRHECGSSNPHILSSNAHVDQEPDMDEGELRDKLVALTTVYGVDLDGMRGLNVNSFLSTTKHPITKLLGTTRKIYDDSKDNFAKRVRPYLDCSFLPDEDLFGDGSSGRTEGAVVKIEPGSSQDPDTLGFNDVFGGGRQVKASRQVWPLVSRVDLYITSSLLDSGIVLEDLPGLSDAMEERMKVARERFRNLDATIIVSPAIRAGDEATCMQLISENEALRMRMDNRLNERTFCVVTSKTDDLNWGKYLRQHVQMTPTSDLGKACNEYLDIKNKVGAKNRALAALLELLAQEEGAHKLALKSCDAFDISDTEEDVTKITARIDAEKMHIKRLSEALEYSSASLAFQASQVRNERTRHKIQEAYERKRSGGLYRGQSKPQAQSQAQAQTQGSSRKDRSLEVIPISADAYWSVKDPDRKEVEGFPTEPYTGIPALRAWIRHSSVPARKLHSMSLLRRLDVLLHNLKAGFGIEDVAMHTFASPKDILQPILNSFQDVLKKNLHHCSGTIVEKVKECNPLLELKRENRRYHPNCRNAIIKQVESWKHRQYPGSKTRPSSFSFRAPQGPITVTDTSNSPTALNWATHMAIIRRYGESYTSGKPYRVTYNWMENMAHLVLGEVVDQWEASFHNRIPQEAIAARPYIEGVWTVSMSKIYKVLPAYCYGPEQNSYLKKKLEAITVVREFAIDGVQRAMLKLVENAKRAHPKVVLVLGQSWLKAFERAQKIGGRGSFRMRQELLEAHAVKETTPIVKEAIQSLDAEIEANIVHMRETIDGVWQESLEMINQQIQSMVQNMKQGGRDVDERARSVNAFILEWESNWRYSDVAINMGLDKEGEGVTGMRLPDSYLARPACFDSPGVDADENVAAIDVPVRKHRVRSPKFGPKPVPKPGPKPGPKPVPKPVPKPGPKPGLKPVPKPGPKPKPSPLDAVKSVPRLARKSSTKRKADDSPTATGRKKSNKATRKKAKPSPSSDLL